MSTILVRINPALIGGYLSGKLAMETILNGVEDAVGDVIQRLQEMGVLRR